MQAAARGEVTQLLLAWRGGDQEALNRLVPLVYTELQQLAQRRLLAHPLEHSLQTTALINEAYLRLADAADLTIHNRVHFLAVCAQVFRGILEDFARSRTAQKRGASGNRLPVDDDLQVGAETPGNIVRLDDALTALDIDPRKAKAIDLRFFGGLSVEETAESLSVSRETALRDWRMARAWLKSELSRAAPYG